jgi:hypothetical protein
VKWTAAFFTLINDAGRELTQSGQKREGGKCAFTRGDKKKGVINAATKTGKKSNNFPSFVILPPLETLFRKFVMTWSRRMLAERY